jgi:hypothetical protein
VKITILSWRNSFFLLMGFKLKKEKHCFKKTTNLLYEPNILKGKFLKFQLYGMGSHGQSHYFHFFPDFLEKWHAKTHQVPPNHWQSRRIRGIPRTKGVYIITNNSVSLCINYLFNSQQKGLHQH